MDIHTLVGELVTVMSRAFPEGRIVPFNGRILTVEHQGRDLTAQVSASISETGALKVAARPIAVLEPRLRFHGWDMSVQLDDGRRFHHGSEEAECVTWGFERGCQGDAVRLTEGLAKIVSDYFGLEALGTRIAARFGEVFPEATVATAERMASLHFKGFHGATVRIKAELGGVDDDRGDIAVYFGPADVFRPFVTKTGFLDDTIMLLGRQCYDRFLDCEEIPNECMGGFFRADDPGVLAFAEGLADIASQHFFVRA